MATPNLNSNLVHLDQPSPLMTSPQSTTSSAMGSAITNGHNADSSLEDLQNDDQRRVLDAVSKIRKCGLDTVLSLPQIVVCGDQSSGKSSVLEALTEIPFPSLTIKIIPRDTRSKEARKKMKNFSQEITDFNELPTVMDKAKEVMGFTEGGSGAFAKDVLCIEIQGPNRPHLTVVDIPGLIQSSTKGVTADDVTLSKWITEYYIKQPRTICLAVVSATNDAANQPILEKVREFDPDGQRTLGVITKPDLLPAGSGSEASFLELARNGDVVFNLGWHVVKNRKFEEQGLSIKERNLSETEFFRTSNFEILPAEDVGIDALRFKLSNLLFEHVKNELPRLQNELNTALNTAEAELELLGKPRSTVAECREFLGCMSMTFYELCGAGINGHYEDDWFKSGNSSGGKVPKQRIRAIVQAQNRAFEEDVRIRGQKYRFACTDEMTTPSARPKSLTQAQGLRWVKDTLRRCRGKELLGNFNSNLLAELFWEQSEFWEEMAKEHIEKVSQDCKDFVSALTDHIASKNVKHRIWSSTILPALEKQREDAFDELNKLLDDRKSFPMNYNHYYTETIQSMRKERIQKAVENAISDTAFPGVFAEAITENGLISFSAWLGGILGTGPADMENFSCEEALDCLIAIYKVQQKTFVANVTTQVIERHIVGKLDKIFSPKLVFGLSDSQVENIASEPSSTKRTRALLDDRINKLQEGKKIFRGVIGI